MGNRTHKQREGVTRIIGIMGNKGHGKDALGTAILNSVSGTYVGRRFAFADMLKHTCRLIFDLSDDQVNGSIEQKEAVDPRWGLSGRQIMQRFGTEVGQNIHQDVWVRATERTIDSWSEKLEREVIMDRLAVITDVRFKHEAAWVMSRGLLVRVVRPELEESGDTHASETEQRDLKTHLVVINNSSLNRLSRAAAYLVDDYEELRAYRNSLYVTENDHYYEGAYPTGGHHGRE